MGYLQNYDLISCSMGNVLFFKIENEKYVQKKEIKFNQFNLVPYEFHEFQEDKIILCGDYDCTSTCIIQIYDISGDKKDLIFKTTDIMFIQSFNSVLLDNQKLILANENKLIVYDIENVKILESQEINETKELECVTKLSGNRFVVGDKDGKIMVYDFKDGKMTKIGQGAMVGDKYKCVCSIIKLDENSFLANSACNLAIFKIE